MPPLPRDKGTPASASTSREAVADTQSATEASATNGGPDSVQFAEDINLPATSSETGSSAIPQQPVVAIIPGNSFPFPKTILWLPGLLSADELRVKISQFRQSLGMPATSDFDGLISEYL